MLNALGAHYTGLGRVARRQKRDEVLIKVVDFYNKAARISSEAVATWVGKGAHMGWGKVRTWGGERCAHGAGKGAHMGWGLGRVNVGEARRGADQSGRLLKQGLRISSEAIVPRNSLLCLHSPPNPPLPFPMTGQLQLVKGEVHQAEEMFSLALAGAPDYVPALLGKVGCWGRWALLGKVGAAGEGGRCWGR
ncbi:unnamed protein product [Closterium sp. NIES-53]